jgi:hypothetical protein
MERRAPERQAVPNRTNYKEKTYSKRITEMAYRDEKQVKAPDGIKCRLDQYDQDRLDYFLDSSGGQPAVVIRDAVIEFLDRRNIKYPDNYKQQEFEQRKLVIAVGDRIRVMKCEVEKPSHHNTSLIAQ